MSMLSYKMLKKPRSIGRKADVLLCCSQITRDGVGDFQGRRAVRLNTVFHTFFHQAQEHCIAPLAHCHCCGPTSETLLPSCLLHFWPLCALPDTLSTPIVSPDRAGQLTEPQHPQHPLTPPHTRTRQQHGSPLSHTATQHTCSRHHQLQAHSLCGAQTGPALQYAFCSSQDLP